MTVWMCSEATVPRLSNHHNKPSWREKKGGESTSRSTARTRLLVANQLWLGFWRRGASPADGTRNPSEVKFIGMDFLLLLVH